MTNDLDELIVRLRQDDKKAFDLLFLMYSEKIFKFSVSFFNNEAEAEEIVQEVFLKIWLKRKDITNPSTINSYIYTIAKNLIRNNLKKNIYRKKYEYYISFYLRETQNHTENAVIYNETKKRIETALDSLPQKRREVFLLSRRDGLKNREIAEKLGISIKTVESHLNLSLKYLDRVLRQC